MLKDDVYYLLEQKQGESITGGWLAKKLKVSRTAVWKAVHVLQAEGCEILSMQGSGYKLLQTNDALNRKAIEDNLNTLFIGRKLDVLDSVDSTNQYLKQADSKTAPGGYVAIADEQTGGRGRKTRVFFSPKGGGVYLSILLKLDGTQSDIRLLTICAAVAVSQAIENICGVRADIKWVNDVFCDGKKICGILTEAVLCGELQELTTVVIGIGINTAAVPKEIENIATSIEQVAGFRGVRNRLAAQLLNCFEKVYVDYIENKNKEAMIKYYESRLFITDRKVLVIDAAESYAALVLGVDENGALIVKTDAGVVRHITTGEIDINYNGE